LLSVYSTVNVHRFPDEIGIQGYLAFVDLAHSLQILNELSNLPILILTPFRAHESTVHIFEMNPEPLNREPLNLNNYN